MRPKALYRIVAVIVMAGSGLFPLIGCGGLTGQASNGSVSLGSNSLSFGQVVVGSTKTISDTITNTTSSAVTISSVQGLGSGYQVTGVSFPLTIAAGQTTNFSVQFQPSSKGSSSLTVSFKDSNGQGVVALGLTGEGVRIGELKLAPASVSFGNTEVGQNQASTVTLSNSGDLDLTVNTATLSGPGFTMSNLALPLTLHTGETTSITVTFAPPSGGTFSGTITFATTSDQQAANVALKLSGTGVPAGTLTPNPASLSFGNILAGSSSSLSETLTNTGGTSLTISAASASGTGFSLSGLTVPLTLSAGQSTSFTVKFAPTAAGAVSGSISITSDGTNPNLSIPLSGTGVTPGTLTANPVSLSFGSVQVGSSASLSETLKNTGGSAVTISQATVSGAAFSISGLTLPVTLTPNQSVTFTAQFTPSGAGGVSGSITVTSDASNSPLTINMSGTGTAPGQLSVSPASLSFGSVAVGTSSSLGGSLTASGGSVTVSSASLNNSEFALSGITLPVTLAAGQSASFNVTFTPQASGATSASLTFASNASNSPTVQSMTGTGTAPIQHTVTLTWVAAAGAVGYNMYRGTQAGGPYAVITISPVSSTTYSDSTVASGQTYYYVATAVDGSGAESGYSNESQAIIPNP